MKTSAITHANVTGFAPQLLLNIQLWNSLYFRAQLFEQLGPELQMQRGSRHVGWTNKRIHELGNVYIHGGDEKVTSISNLMSNLWLCFEKKKKARERLSIWTAKAMQKAVYISLFACFVPSAYMYFIDGMILIRNHQRRVETSHFLWRWYGRLTSNTWKLLILSYTWS